MLRRYSANLGILVLSIAVGSCRPIIAIGWPEFIILTLLIAVLLGPFLFRLYRFIDKAQKASKSEEKRKK